MHFFITKLKTKSSQGAALNEHVTLIILVYFIATLFIIYSG